MYLIIEIQTGDIFRKHALTADDYSDCIMGYINIIDISNPKSPEIYSSFTQEWYEVEEHNQQ